ncbi:MAG: DUF2304 family protein [Candidatus Hydrothermarchaeaceae archaeon]
MIWIQVVGAIFALDMMFITYFYHRRGVFFLHDSIIWMSVWVSLFLVSVFPNSLELVVEPLQFIRVMDFLTVGSFFLMFSLIFAVFTRSRNNDKKLQELVRDLALKEVEMK